MVKTSQEVQKNTDLFATFHDSMEERDKRVKDIHKIMDLNKDQLHTKVMMLDEKYTNEVAELNNKINKINGTIEKQSKLYQKLNDHCRLTLEVQTTSIMKNHSIEIQKLDKVSNQYNKL